VRLAGKTAVVVSHRVSAVVDLDRVIVLEGGRIVESGPPKELIAKGGALADLARMQRDAEALGAEAES
jgi:ATP-binding cassette subfamily B protein